MEREEAPPLPFMLLLRSDELQPIRDALLDYSLELVKSGDSAGALRMMDIRTRISNLQGIDFDISYQTVLALGIGISRRRPQG